MSSPVLPDFTGEWRITRRMFGHDARFAGRAVIDIQGHYREDGILKTPGHEGPAWQDYVYQAVDDTLRITFPDGRVFLTLRFENGQARGVHHCGDDVYDARFRLRGDGWVAAYTVRGPRKDYTVVSVMRRHKN